MADEKDDVLEEGGEETVATVETDDTQQPETDTDDEAVVSLARDMGWTPKEEFKGDPSRYRSPRDFILASRDIQRERGHEIASLRQTLDTVQRTNAVIVERQLAAEREKLTARYEQAVEDGDAQAARRIGSEIDKIEVTATELTRPSGPDPVVASWVEKNSWFNTDPLAHAKAKEVAAIYAQRGETPAVQLAKAEEEVRRVYPHLFNEQRRPASVERPQSRAPQQNNRSKGFNDLPREAQAIARDMAERGLITKEDYAREYWVEASKGGKAR